MKDIWFCNVFNSFRMRRWLWREETVLRLWTPAWSAQRSVWCLRFLLQFVRKYFLGQELPPFCHDYSHQKLGGRKQRSSRLKVLHGGFFLAHSYPLHTAWRSRDQEFRIGGSTWVDRIYWFSRSWWLQLPSCSQSGWHRGSWALACSASSLP